MRAPARAPILAATSLTLLALAACSSDVAPAGGGTTERSAAAGTTESSAESVRSTIATFEGDFDAATGRVTLRPQTTVNYGTASHQVYMHTASTTWVAPNFTGNVACVSNLTATTLTGVTAVIDSIAGSGVTAPGAPFSYGTVTAGQTTSTVPWVFNDPGGVNFYFKGHIDATVPAAPAGVVGYYRGAGVDLSGNGHNLSLTSGSIPVVADRFGNPGVAGLFNGSSWLTATSDTSLPMGSSARTVSVWFITSTSFGAAGSLYNYGQSGGTTGERFGMLITGSTEYFVGESEDSAGTKVVNDGKWHNIVATYNGSVETTWVDGAIDNSKTLPLNTTITTLEVGQSSFNHGSNEIFTGTIDQLRIYNSVLSGAQIAQLYQEGGW